MIARILPGITIAVCVSVAAAINIGSVVWLSGRFEANSATTKVLAVTVILSAIPAIVMLPRTYDVHVAKDIWPVLLLAAIVGAVTGAFATFAVGFVFCGPLC